MHLTVAAECVHRTNGRRSRCAMAVIVRFPFRWRKMKNSLLTVGGAREGSKSNRRRDGSGFLEFIIQDHTLKSIAFANE